MNELYLNTYVCIAVDMNNMCTAYLQQQNSGVITPELMGIIIGYAFILNLLVFGFKYIKRAL